MKDHPDPEKDNQQENVEEVEDGTTKSQALKYTQLVQKLQVLLSLE